MAESSEGTTKNPRAESFFQYGNDATLKNNFDYAINMYREALKIDPGNLVYRQALRGAQRRVFGGEPTKVGRMAGARVQPIKLGMKTAKSRGKWSDVLESCEDVFKHNPWDVGAAEDAADAAEHLGFNPLAQWYMESVAAQSGDNEQFYIHLGRTYELNNQWEQAIRAWEKAGRINPNNDEVRRKVRSLAASSTISRSGLEGSIRTSTEKNNAKVDNALAEAEELKRASQTPEVRMLKELEAQPDHVGLYLSLAEHYKNANRLDDAEKILAKGRKAVPDDDVLKSVHADIQISRLRRGIDHYAKKVRDNPDDIEAPEKLAALKEKLSVYELGEYRRRVEAHPDDAALFLHYGRLLAGVGKHDEAIAAFQQARSNPELKVQALLQSGLSFEAKNLPKLAERNFQEALRLTDKNDQGLINSLNYRLGRAAEMQGNYKAAEEFYNEVAAEDYTYLDVADRLRDLNKKT